MISLVGLSNLHNLDVFISKMVVPNCSFKVESIDANFEHLIDYFSLIMEDVVA